MDNGRIRLRLNEYLQCVVCHLDLRDPVLIIDRGYKFCSLGYNRVKVHFSVSRGQSSRGLRHVIVCLVVRCTYHTRAIPAWRVWHLKANFCTFYSKTYLYSGSGIWIIGYIIFRCQWMKNNWIKFSDYTQGNFVVIWKRVTCVTLVGHDFSDVDTLQLFPVNESCSYDRVLVVCVCLRGTQIGWKTQRMTKGLIHVISNFVAWRVWHQNVTCVTAFRRLIFIVWKYREDPFQSSKIIWNTKDWLLNFNLGWLLLSLGLVISTYAQG